MNKVRTWEISKVITESGEYTSVIGPDTAEHFGMETYVKVVDAKDFEKAVVCLQSIVGTLTPCWNGIEWGTEESDQFKLARQTLRELGIGANK